MRTLRTKLRNKTALFKVRKTQHHAKDKDKDKDKDKASHIKPWAQNATPNETLQMQQSNRQKLAMI